MHIKSPYLIKPNLLFYVQFKLMMQICGETPKTHVQKGQKEYDEKKSVMQIVDVSLL